MDKNSVDSYMRRSGKKISDWYMDWPYSNADVYFLEGRDDLCVVRWSSYNSYYHLKFEAIYVVWESGGKISSRMCGNNAVYDRRSVDGSYVARFDPRPIRVDVIRVEGRELLYEVGILSDGSDKRTVRIKLSELGL